MRRKVQCVHRRRDQIFWSDRFWFAPDFRSAGFFFHQISFSWKTKFENQVCFLQIPPQSIRQSMQCTAQSFKKKKTIKCFFLFCIFTEVHEPQPGWDEKSSLLMMSRADFSSSRPPGFPPNRLLTDQPTPRGGGKSEIPPWEIQIPPPWTNPNSSQAGNLTLLVWGNRKWVAEGVAWPVSGW